MQASKQNVIQSTADVHIFAPFGVNLANFLSNNPSSCFVLLFKNPNENGGELNLVFSVVFPLTQIFLIFVVVLLHDLIGFFGGSFSLSKVIHHLAMVFKRLILVATFLQPFRLIGFDKIEPFFEEIPVVSDNPDVLLVPVFQLLNHILCIGGVFALVQMHGHLHGVRLTK
jgi:hypothetical protein